MRWHDEANNDRIDELERDPLAEVIAADHTDEYRDPDPVRGHIPDVVYEDGLGRTVLVETERQGDDSSHAKSQQEAFGAAAQEPGVGFELNPFGESEDDSSGLFDFF